eukprot:5004463-Pyramimonas_sp.AAC.1
MMLVVSTLFELQAGYGAGQRTSKQEITRHLRLQYRDSCGPATELRCTPIEGRAEKHQSTASRRLRS